MTDFFNLIDKIAQHMMIAFSATFLALLIGIPLGITMHYYQKVRGFFLATANVFQTIPSLALLAFLVPFLGIGFKPTITALTIYALLPILRNTFTGLTQVPAETIEAAHAMGFTVWQRLRLVELPLAMPVILSGVRIAMAMTIGITTIAAFIGAGGLGDFINTGLSMANTHLILLGAIPTALLALSVDFLIANLEILGSTKVMNRFRIILSVLLGLLLAAILVFHGLRYFLSAQRATIVIASKNFTEQFILATLMADVIAEYTDLKVKKVFNLETTEVIHQAMLAGQVDLYAEYSGTAYYVILKKQQQLPKDQLFNTVKCAYQSHYGLRWLAPLGFENSQTLAVRKTLAQANRLVNLSDLVPLSMALSLAAPSEFLTREDSYPLLQKNYGFRFKTIRQMQPNLAYTAIAHDAVDVIEVFTTDGRLQHYHLVALNDDKQVYPAYQVAPVIRQSVLEAHPELAVALDHLAGKIKLSTMRHLNYLVDIKHQPVEKVARDFLKQLETA